MRSYKQLPQIWYQIQTKFRDEPRPRAGLLRVRQFLHEGLLQLRYRRRRTGRLLPQAPGGVRPHLRTLRASLIAVEAHSGAMGGGQSHEFAVVSEAGEDTVAVCPGCGYAANLEKAVAVRPPPAGARSRGRSAARAVRYSRTETIADLAQFTGLPETSQMKSLVLVADGKPVLVAAARRPSVERDQVRGGVAGDPEFRPAYPDGDSRTGSAPSAGSLGPVGVSNDADPGGPGAGRTAQHDLGRQPRRLPLAPRHSGRGFRGGAARSAGRSRRAISALRCGGPLDLQKTIEVGHIFKLGLKYSEPMGLRVLNADGREVTPLMGSYGIGIERILCAASRRSTTRTA